jgi:hypothetical protein
MARLRKTNNITVLVSEETTRFAHFFNLLIEIDLRLPKTTKTKVKAKTEKCEIQGKHRPIEKKHCCIKRPAICNPSSSIWWDLFLNPFNRIFNGVTFDLCSIASA